MSVGPYVLVVHEDRWISETVQIGMAPPLCFRVQTGRGLEEGDLLYPAVCQWCSFSFADLERYRCQ